MNISHLNIGIIHSVIGKNDGVSIVIDQSVTAMTRYMKVPLGNIYFLAAHVSARFNTETNEVFWHKNEINKKIVSSFSDAAQEGMKKEINDNAVYAKNIISDFIKRNKIDLIIAHNTSHPYNFITAVALGYYLEERKKKSMAWPKVLVWWHDSFLERERFGNPNPVVSKFLKYLPGTDIDGIVFINKAQMKLAKKNSRIISERCTVIPNTCDINWEWDKQNWESSSTNCPPQDNYNKSFFRDIGLSQLLEDRNLTREQNIILLQHTRVVARKKIETAIDFSMKIAEEYKKHNIKKSVTLLISGHSGDEDTEYKNFLKKYAEKKTAAHPDIDFFLIFGEHRILSRRDIIVDKKYYSFSEIPAIVSAAGGLGTYFSEIEGFGNNLLEMISSGLPVVINKYKTYRKEIEPLGFNLPAITNGLLTKEVVDNAFLLLTDIPMRNKLARHNLSVLKRKLSHKIIARKLKRLLINILFRS